MEEVEKIPSMQKHDFVFREIKLTIGTIKENHTAKEFAEKAKGVYSLHYLKPA